MVASICWEKVNTLDAYKTALWDGGGRVTVDDHNRELDVDSWSKEKGVWSTSAL